MLYVLNTLITPIDFDKHKEATVKFRRINVNEAKEILKREANVKSVVGHEVTAKLMSELLEREIPFNRETVFFEKGDKGLHFFLKERLPEGKILSKEELEKLRYWLVLSEVI